MQRAKSSDDTSEPRAGGGVLLRAIGGVGTVPGWTDSPKEPKKSLAVDPSILRTSKCNRGSLVRKGLFNSEVRKTDFLSRKEMVPNSYLMPDTSINSRRVMT